MTISTVKKEDMKSVFKEFEQPMPTFNELLANAHDIAQAATEMAEMVQGREADAVLRAMRRIEFNIRGFRRDFNRLTELRFKE